MGELLEWSGIFGLAITLLEALFLVTGAIFAFVRVPRRVAAALLVTALFLPLALGTFGMLVGRASANRQFVMLAAVTPRDLAAGDQQSEASLIIGLAAGLTCYAALLPAFARSRTQGGDA